ncbi:FHA domain-containing protein [Actinomycetospora sp. CA-084318]|uniref:FHA domain-containing protein n=1 Tax=Actinomycetospora sp. CA-084318 TaxID=3239892 RepID=UPI003D96D726
MAAFPPLRRDLLCLTREILLRRAAQKNRRQATNGTDSGKGRVTFPPGCCGPPRRGGRPVSPGVPSVPHTWRSRTETSAQGGSVAEDSVSDTDTATSTPSFLEVSRPGGTEVVLLVGTTMTIGRAPSNNVVLAHDGHVSSLHAVMQAYGTSWAIRDLGSTNGTVVAGERLLTERALRHGDIIMIGSTRVTYRGPDTGRAADRTNTRRSAPELTRRERDVLHALCRPLASDAVFREPATARDIAAALVVTEAAVKQHLLRLYDKFELDPASTRRRVELANEALQRGAVNPADL